MRAMLRNMSQYYPDALLIIEDFENDVGLGFTIYRFKNSTFANIWKTLSK